MHRLYFVKQAELKIFRLVFHIFPQPAAGEAAEDLGVPGGADHHVSQLHRPDVARVTKLVNAPKNMSSEIRESSPRWSTKNIVALKRDARRHGT